MSRLPQIANPHRQAYPKDMSDGEWEVLRWLVPEPPWIWTSKEGKPADLS